MATEDSINTSGIPEIEFDLTPQSNPPIAFTLQAGTTITQPTDKTLSHENQPADAKAVGDALAEINETESDIVADVASLASNVSKIIPVLAGATNDTGYTINSGDYFEASGTLYKATAAIPDGSEWSGSATALTAGVTAINALNSDIGLLQHGKVCTTAAQVISALNAYTATTGNGLISITNANKDDIFTSAINQSSCEVRLYENKARWANHPEFIISSENSLWTGRVGKSGDVWTIEEIFQYALNNDVVMLQTYHLTSSQELLATVLNDTIVPQNSARWIDPRGGSVSGGATTYGMALATKRYTTAQVIVYADDGTQYVNSYDVANSVWRGWDTVVFNSKIATQATQTSGTVTYWKSGNMVTVSVYNANSTTTWTEIAVLPTGYRPPVLFRTSIMGGAYGGTNVGVELGTNGSIKLQSASSLSSVYGIFTFAASN